MSDSSSGVPIKHTDPGQDAYKVQNIANEVARVLTPNEEILYIALQTSVAGRSDAAVATSNRLILYKRPIIGGANFIDLQWQDIKNVTLKQGMTAADITAQTIEGRSETLGWLNKDQAKRLYGIAQQLEQEWREKRRVREMEEARARAGGIVMSAPIAAPASVNSDDPVQKLGKAKAMLDQGLISDDEYNALKAKILGAM